MAVAQGVLDRARDIGECEGRVASLCGRINALEGELVGVLAELFAVGAHEGPGLRSAGHYVAWLTGTARGRAGALVAAAERMAEFPATTARLQAGEISLDQTAAVVRCAPGWADDVMAGCAGVMTPAQLTKTARLHQAADTAAQASPSEAPVSPPVQESLLFHGHDAGGWVGRLRLDADRGAEFDGALRAHLDVLWTQWRAAGRVGHAPTLVDALMQMVRRAVDADTIGVDTGGVEFFVCGV